MLNSGTIFTAKTVGLLKDFLFSGNADTIPIRLREAFEELGATYIKLGQFIASAPSLFPKEYVSEMQRCLDSVRPIPFSDVKRIIERELKGRISDHFASVEEQPIASASIAQVHGAITKDGLDVVIKVQRPDIESILDTDMNLIYFASIIFEKIAPGLNHSGLSDIVKDFQNSIMQEIDFVQEAKNIEEFDSYLLKAGESRAKVPRVYHELSTKKVLTMERLYGVPLTDPEKLVGYSRNPKKTLTDALDIWFASLSHSGFFHADVHAGNLLALKDGRIGFIDFGIVGRISTRVWKGLMLFMEGLSLNRSDLMAKGLIDMDGTIQGIDEKQFANDLNRILYQLSEFAMDIQMGDLRGLDEGKLNRIMFDISDVSKRNGLRIPREFALLIKQMLYFDRYVKALAPEIDIIRDQKMFMH